MQPGDSLREDKLVEPMLDWKHTSEEDKPVLVEDNKELDLLCFDPDVGNYNLLSPKRKKINIMLSMKPNKRIQCKEAYCRRLFNAG